MLVQKGRPTTHGTGADSPWSFASLIQTFHSARLTWPYGDNRMPHIAFTGCILLASTVLGCGKTATDPIVLAKIERFTILADLLMGDHRRHTVPALLDDLDLTTGDGITKLDARIKQYETLLDAWPNWCPDRGDAIEKLKSSDFHVGDRISNTTVASFVGVFLNNEYLDPRILSLSRIDARIIEIETGLDEWSTERYRSSPSSYAAKHVPSWVSFRPQIQ